MAGISPTGGSFSFTSLSQLTNGFRTSRSLSANGDLSASTQESSLKTSTSTVDRIERLIGQIQEDSLQLTGNNSSSKASQNAINRALVEIGRLVGSPIRPGGADRAVVSGVDQSQIASYEVLELAPNANLRVSGALTNQPDPAAVLTPGLSTLLQQGGVVQVSTGNRQEGVYVQAGASVGQFLGRLNQAGSGSFTARRLGEQIQLRSLSVGQNASLSVSTSFTALSEPGTPSTLSGVNGSQITAVDFGGLALSSDLTVTGSRDSLAQAAELAYDGSSGAVVAGNATFTLNGPNGSTSLSLTAGEALSDVAQRVNDATSTTGVLAVVSGNQLQLATQQAGSAANLSITDIVREESVNTTGVNATQVANFTADGVPTESTITIDGSISQTAAAAQAIYTGTSGAVAATASFSLTGSLGTESISITEGEALTLVADRVNAETANTGIVATVSGDDLFFETNDVGSSESVTVELTSITQDVSFSGVNASQLSDFQVVSAAADSENTLTGTVDQAATGSELVFQGTIGNLVGTNATFDLTGQLGTASISVTNLESLNAVRDRINLESATTGITASVSGNELTLQSDGVGSEAVVEIDVQSGSFNTTGGDGSGNAAGTDVQLTLNGQSISGTGAAGNEVSYTDALGQYTFTVDSGFVGAIDPVTVTSEAGAFDLSGVDGTGTAFGTDAQAVLNGQSLTATGNLFSFTDSGASFTLETQAAFVGTLDTITVTSTLADFSLSGGNEDGTADGADSQATLNGQSLTSSDDQFTLTTGEGSVSVTFAEDYQGAFDAFTITAPEPGTTLSGGSRFATAQGSDGTFSINGQTLRRDGDRYLYEQQGTRIALTLAKDFSGSLTSFTVAAPEVDATPLAHKPLTGSEANRLQRIVQPLTSLATGGSRAGITSRVLVTSLEVLSEIHRVEGKATNQNRRSLTGGLIDFKS